MDDPQPGGSSRRTSALQSSVERSTAHPRLNGTSKTDPLRRRRFCRLRATTNWHRVNQAVNKSLVVAQSTEPVISGAPRQIARQTVSVALGDNSTNCNDPLKHGENKSGGERFLSATSPSRRLARARGTGHPCCAP